MVRAMTVLVVLASLLTVTACGAEKIKSAPEARAVIRKLLEGADPSDFKLADDASASARAIMTDATEVDRLKNGTPVELGVKFIAAA